MNIISITIVKDSKKAVSGSILATTDLPEPCWPFKNNLVVKFQAVKAEEYCAKNFPGVPVSVVATS